MDKLIPLGHIMMTRGVERETRETEGFRSFCMNCVERHRDHDWGDIPEKDKQTNNWAADHEERLLSAYEIPRYYCLGYADKIWIITEADRSTTTILFPDEY